MLIQFDAMLILILNTDDLEVLVFRIEFLVSSATAVHTKCNFRKQIPVLFQRTLRVIKMLTVVHTGILVSSLVFMLFPVRISGGPHFESHTGKV